jgi:rod shape-determining protein MreD
MIAPRLRFLGVLLLVLVIQASLGPRLVIFGARADVVLLLAIAAGIVGGPEEGALAGFVCGLAADLALGQDPVGLAALVYGGAGFAVGNLQGSVLGATWWTPMVSAGAASGVATVVYAVLGAVLGHTEWITPHTLVVAAVVAVVNGLLSPLAIGAMHWVEGGGLPSLPRPGSRSSGPRRGTRGPFPRVRLPSLPVGRRAPKMSRRPPTLWKTVSAVAGGPTPILPDRRRVGTASRHAFRPGSP